ncbi:hypothetical protein MDA_GLEAN10010440 [Myotis davidii]|uniref:Uncharacterized protein n=1 Tax=Myotis davidii TaxID=225400 RepID=L5MCL8_MYODS|nr:hypothetical protein MDA_GLEAN10010440 [Myotis davidii]
MLLQGPGGLVALLIPELRGLAAPLDTGADHSNLQLGPAISTAVRETPDSHIYMLAHMETKPSSSSWREAVF